MVLRPTGGGAQAHGRGGVGIGGSVLRLTAFWISPGWLAANVLAESTQQSFLSSIIKGSQTQDRDKQTVCLACQVDNLSKEQSPASSHTGVFVGMCPSPHTHTHLPPPASPSSGMLLGGWLPRHKIGQILPRVLSTQCHWA